MLEDDPRPGPGPLPLSNANGDATEDALPLRRRVIVVDDYAPSADGLAEHMESWGYEARAAYSAEQAIELAETFEPELVVSDLVMPGASGIQLLEQLRARNQELEFLMLTGQGTIETAKEAIQKGAFDYLTKPVDPAHLKHLLGLAAERLNSRRTMRELRRVIQNQGWDDDLVGDSPPMIELKRLMEQVAPSAASVMITGESGTGKELVARTLHRWSPRAAKAFIPINCAAIPENLLESELFGHERGAFTGAVAMRQGAFELADGGTLFLDEIAEMPALLQAKLLRALEERSFRRVGGSVEITVDVRVIAATNRDLDDARRTGALREDLYYRLNVFHLLLPPLRDRANDKLTLAHRFVASFANREGKAVVGLDDSTRYLIMSYSWPGNVRELQERHGARRDRRPRRHHRAREPARDGARRAVGTDPVVLAGMTVDDVERRLILLTLEKTGGNKTKAARLLDVSLKTLHNKLRRYREEGMLSTDPAGESPALAPPRDDEASSQGREGTAEAQ